MKTTVAVQRVRCPHCGSDENHPTDDAAVLIRGLKVFDAGKWWSQCLVCSGGYDENLEFREENHDPTKGWF